MFMANRATNVVIAQRGGDAGALSGPIFSSAINTMCSVLCRCRKTLIRPVTRHASNHDIEVGGEGRPSTRL